MRTIEQRAADFLTQSALPAGGILICAVSGGPDSVTLLELMRKIAPEKGLSVEAAHLNHGLRGRNPTGTRRLSARSAGKRRSRSGPSGRGCPSGRGRRGRVSRASPARCGMISLSGSPASGRGDWVQGVGSNRPHRQRQRRDAALPAGAGQFSRWRGGIPPVRGRYLRPLLGCTREEILRYCEMHHCGYVIDGTNLEPCCSRNRIRLQVMPTLRKINPGAERALAAFAADAREDAAFLDQLAQELLCRARQGAGWRCAQLASAPGPVLRSALARLLTERGCADREKIGACRGCWRAAAVRCAFRARSQPAAAGGSSISKRLSSRQRKTAANPLFVGKQRLCDGRILSVRLLEYEEIVKLCRCGKKELKILQIMV